MKKERMIRVKKAFLGKIFEKVIEKYGGSINAGKYLKIPASSIRGYKNGYFGSIPQWLIDRIILLRMTSHVDVKNNTLSSFYKEDQIEKNLNGGRQKRLKNLKVMRENIPPLNALIKFDKIFLKDWLEAYAHLLNSGFRKVKISEDNDYFILNYSNFAKDQYRDFEVRIPKIIELNEEFIYFFGLWCGDRAGGKRFGVCNKNEQINSFVERFLSNYGQKVEKILYITKNQKLPRIEYDKKFVIDKDINGWVLSIHSNNGVLASFFYYLQSNLNEFLEYCEKNKKIFFAGLFDAEGNVSLHNRSFRWACKNKESVKIYSSFLKEESLFDRYDGNCLISNNKKGFYDNILPYLKHKEKINLTQIMCKGEGKWPKEYLDILKEVYIHSNRPQREISKALKKNKIYTELSLLSNFGLISFKGYPHRFEITSKGLKLTGD